MDLEKTAAENGLGDELALVQAAAGDYLLRWQGLGRAAASGGRGRNPV